MNEWFFKKLTKIYEESNKYIHKSDINPCGLCVKCCTVQARLGIRLIEYAYIERFIKEIAHKTFTVQSFRDYINKKKNIEGEFLYNICPYYNIKNRGCQIYPARTMSCRLFPYYTTKDDVFFEGCPLNSKAELITPENILKKLPFLQEYYYLTGLFDNYIANQFRPF